MNSWLSRTLAKVIFLAAVFGIALAGIGLSGTGQANAAPPSGTVKSTHGAWSIICDTTAGPTVRTMRDDAERRRRGPSRDGAVGRRAAHRRQQGRDPARAGAARRAVAQRLGLNVDGKDIGRAYFVRCFQDGCYAEVILEKPLLDTLKTGTSATFIVFQTPEEGIGIPSTSRILATVLPRCPDERMACYRQSAPSS